MAARKSLNPSALLYRAREKASERDSETSPGGYALLHPRNADSSLRSNNENVYFPLCESTITSSCWRTDSADTKRVFLARYGKTAGQFMNLITMC